MSTDRNLLFGVLALQADLLSHAQFVEACSTWATRKDTPLADLLIERGWLTPSDRADVDKLLHRKIAKHRGDVRVSLAEVTSDPVRRSLAGLDDVDVHASIGSPTPPPTDKVLFPTGEYFPEGRHRYTLSRLHATGGIGRVWVARDPTLGRDVALKELRPERSGHAAALARFVREAQVTGQLEHPGIVPIYEAGRRPDDNAPFYTMRLVRGRTLAEAASAYHQDRSRGTAEAMTLRRLIHSLVGVCNAIAYAHSRGVLHRDLKPQNVVLGDYGEVIVLDWGLAKVTGTEEATGIDSPLPVVAEEVEATVTGQVIGTPAYMAPEQAEGRIDLLSPSTDVYGLGAILYQVLTGRVPFSDVDTVTVLRRVMYDPVEPPRSVVPQTPAALDAVCRKALAKRPADRYPSAAVLAADLEHWLADEPVSAYREPLAVRAGRWMRRHRTLAVAAVATTVVAATCLGVATLVLKQANTREHQAREGEREARLRAEKNFGLARTAVDRYFIKVSDSPQLKAHGLEKLRHDLLQQAREFYEQFLKTQADEPGLQAERGMAYLRLAEIIAEMGNCDESIRMAHQGKNEFEQLLTTQPDKSEYQDSLARSLVLLGRNYYELHQYPQAKSAFDQVLSLRERLAKDYPEQPGNSFQLAVVLNDLGKLYRLGLGQLTEGEAAYQRALTLCESLAREHPKNPEYQSELARTLHHLAESQGFRDKPELAKETFAKALPILEKLARDQADEAGYQDQLAETLHDLAVQHINTHQPKEALALCGKARGVCERLVREHPLVTVYQNRLMRVRVLAAGALAMLNNHKEAAAEVEAVVSTFVCEGETLYNAACALAESSQAAQQDKSLGQTERDRLMEGYLARAVALLYKAEEQGLFQAAAVVELLKTDSELQPLRERADFKKLLKTVEDRGKKKP